MGRRWALFFLCAVGVGHGVFAQTKLLDSLRLRLQSNLADTTRLLLLESYIKGSRVDYSDSAIAAGKTAVAFAEKIQDKKWQARTLTLLGTAYYFGVDYAMADKTHRMAVEFCRKEKLDSEIANALGSFALTLQSEQKFEEAFEAYFEALRREEANANDMGVVKTQANLSILYRNLGDIDNALKYAMAAYKVLVTKDWALKPAMLASVSNGIALAYLDKAQYDSALFYLRDAYRLNRANNNNTYTANAASNIAYCYIAQNNADSASVYIKKAYDLLPKINNEEIKSAIYTNYGAVLHMQNKLVQAMEFAQQGLALAKKVNSKRWILYGYRTLGEILQQRGQYKQAYELSNRAYLLNDSLQVYEAQRKAANMQRDYEIQKKQQSIDLLAKQAQLDKKQLATERLVKLYLAASLALLLAAAGAIYYALRQKLNTNKKLEAKNEEIARKNEALESVNRNLQDQALRIQMKPHFIFNALNSIQFLILQKENEKAYDYLSKFSKLLRSSLEFGDRNFIELQKELEWLELYVSLESLRFNHGFSFNVDNRLPAEAQSNVKLPPFLVQPFLENAIAHGLMTKTGDRKLNLAVEEVASKLVITVADNGIGRKAAAELNARNRKNHRSFGMDIVQKRLEILKTITGKEFVCATADGVNESGEPEGTVVKIELPI